ncbi:MAG: zeta toxin family protein [Methylobacter sp.]
MSTKTQPICWIIAGPNGAGKTTFALKYLPTVANCSAFVNADLIAAGLSPLAPEKELITASRLFLKEIAHYIQIEADFAFETTLSGRSYLQLINRLKTAGWRVELIYLALPSAEMSKMRVLERVAHGGHNIPVQAIERRFPRSLHNLLTEFSYLAHQTRCFMNDGESPSLIFVQQEESREIINEHLFNHLLQQAEL